MWAALSMSSTIWSVRSVGLRTGQLRPRGTDVAPNLSLAPVSDVLLTWAVFCYAFAMLGYAAEFAATRRSMNHGGDQSAALRGAKRGQRFGQTAVVLTF